MRPAASLSTLGQINFQHDEHPLSRSTRTGKTLSHLVLPRASRAGQW